MKSLYISLNSIDKVTDFVNHINCIEGEVWLCSEQYVINAKSVVGVFSLDLSKTLYLRIENWKEEYFLLVEKYLVNKA